MTLCSPLLLHSPHNCLSSFFCSGPPVPSGVLVLHIDNKARRSRRRCHRKPVLPSAPCVHKCTQLYIVLPTRFRASAHTIAPPMPRAPPPRHNCATTAEQPSPAAPHTAAHPRPSPCTRIHTHVIHTPDSASPAYSTQVMPVSVPSRYYIRPVSEIARLLYTRAPPCPRKSLCPQYIPPCPHPFAAATPWSVPCP